MLPCWGRWEANHLHFCHSCVAGLYRPPVEIFKSVPDCSPDSMAWGGLQDHRVTRACTAPTMHLLHLLSPPGYLYPDVAHPQNEKPSCIYMLSIQTEAHAEICHCEKATPSHAAWDAPVGVAAPSVPLAHLAPVLPFRSANAASCSSAQ